MADFVGERPCGGTVGDVARMRVAQWSETLPSGSSDDTPHGTTFDCFPDTTGIYVVPPDHYSMMGDNRENSEGSRVVG